MIKSIITRFLNDLLRFCSERVPRSASSKVERRFRAFSSNSGGVNEPSHWYGKRKEPTFRVGWVEIVNY